MMVWNVAAILDLAGGAQNLKKLMARHGQDVPDSGAISMWKNRNRLPAGWSAQVLYAVATHYAGKKANIVIDLRDLVVNEPETQTSEHQAGSDDDLFAAD